MTNPKIILTAAAVVGIALGAAAPAMAHGGHQQAPYGQRYYGQRDHHWHSGWYLSTDGYYYPYAAPVYYAPAPAYYAPPPAPVYLPPVAPTLNITIR